MASKKKRAKKVDERDWRELCDIAAAKLDSAPALEYNPRATPTGDLVADFAMPLKSCPTTNQTRYLQGYVAAGMKTKLWRILSSQCREFKKPLSGRPQVLCVRFSPTEVDPCSDWAKWPVDMLTCLGGRATKHRLGLLKDDKQSNIDLRQRWEPVAKKEQGFCYIAVFTGSSGA